MFHQWVLVGAADAGSFDLDHHICSGWFRGGHFIQGNFAIA
jgi:hypothetical protein